MIDIVSVQMRWDQLYNNAWPIEHIPRWHVRLTFVRSEVKIRDGGLLLRNSVRRILMMMDPSAKLKLANFEHKSTYSELNFCTCSTSV